MREFKFRIWKNGWISLSRQKLAMCSLIDGYKDGFVIQQFTGLLDKDGKEIYEGDTVYSSDDEEVYTIVFYKGMFCVRYPEGIFAPLYEFPEVVVCGNIFEP